MPWTAEQFASRHNHSLSGEKAAHAARIANAILKSGATEGLSIATANKWAQHHARAEGGPIHRALHTVSDIHRRHLAYAGVATPFTRQDIYAEDAPVQGFLGGDTLGRADAKNASVTSGAYVLPADVLSGLGEGNSLAGAGIVQKWLGTGPWGTPLPQQRHGAGPPRAATSTRMPQLQYEKGGGTPSNKGDKSPVDVALSDGEFSVSPEIVAHHQDLGALNPADHNPKHYEAALKRGHDILDHLVLELRARHIKELKTLPKPAQ